MLLVETGLKLSGFTVLSIVAVYVISKTMHSLANYPTAHTFSQAYLVLTLYYCNFNYIY